MSIFLSLFRVIKFSFQNFFRNFWLSFITMTIFVLTLFTINAVIFMNVLAEAALESIEQKVEVSVYFEPDTSEDLVKSVQGYLMGLTQVRTVEFISEEDALQSFQERHKDNPVILSSLDEVDGNPFGHALVISAHSANDFPFILEALDTPEYEPFIKQKDYQDYETIIARINALAFRVRVGGFILAAFFSLIAVMIIFNTIRVAIYVYRDEIGIMKLVGANDWFVRGPFLVEALMYSLFATLVVVAFAFFGLDALGPWLATYFGDTDMSVINYFKDNALLIFGSQFLALSTLSILTTMFAMRRYLRV
ncbi:MAG: permease-like cell division protein FtsX [Patescibacteria group bacterium]|nr:ABC transporter permease [Patescibacteria group bacterium]